MDALRRSLHQRRPSARTRGSTGESAGSLPADGPGRSHASSAEDEEATVYEAFLDGPAVNKKCVVGIDFGTTNSGFAYAMTADKKIRVVRKKEPTCVLFRRDNNQLIEFGIEARNAYRKFQAGQELLSKFSASTQDSHWEDDLLYIDQDLKMKLYNHDHNDLMEPNPRIGISYFELLSAVLRRIKDTALERIRRDQANSVGLGDSLEVSDILWVVTVPSIWRESDKQFMRRAARDAELIQDEFSGDLVIALESECAAVWSEVLFDRKGCTPIKEGDRVLCLDCGGGTVDISAIRIVTKKNVGSPEQETLMAQLLPPTGLKVGSQQIDRRFRKFLRQFLGEDNFDHCWAQPEVRMELQDGWERLKCSLQANNFSSKKRAPVKTLNLEATLSELKVKLADLVNVYNAYALDKARKRGRGTKPIRLDYRKLTRRPCVLIIPPTLLHYCFDSTVSLIVEKTKEVLSTYLKDGVEHLIMYGGLGKCDYLQFCVDRTFSSVCNIHKPTDASLAVMKGAVKYGMFPRIINSRRARMTVGVKVTLPFIRGMHNKQPHIKHKQYDEASREYYIRDAFKTFVVRGQLVDVSGRYTHTFSPAGNRDSIKFDIYASSAQRVEYVTEPGCLKLARIVVPIKKGSMSKVTMSLSFGYTEIRAYVLDEEGRVVREVPLLFDHVGENAIISEGEAQDEDDFKKTSIDL